MKKMFILNRVSNYILHTGLFVCTLSYFGVLIHLYHRFQAGTVKINEFEIMLENVTMSVLLVVIFALVLDIHIKFENKKQR